VLVALEADVFFWVVGEIACSCSLGRAVFRLFGDTNVDITSGSAIGVLPQGLETVHLGPEYCVGEPFPRREGGEWGDGNERTGDEASSR
jgi:hypothetical protein